MRRKVLAQSQVHPVSKLVAAVEDDGYSGHLYLAKSGKTKRNLAFFWIYNRGPAPTDDTAIARGQNQHWEAWKGVAGPQARCPNPEKSVWTFVWSDDGESLVLALKGAAAVPGWLPVAWGGAGCAREASARCRGRRAPAAPSRKNDPLIRRSYASKKRSACKRLAARSVSRQPSC